jgi:hypothetical protein
MIMDYLTLSQTLYIDGIDVGDFIYYTLNNDQLQVTISNTETVYNITLLNNDINYSVINYFNG